MLLVSVLTQDIVRRKRRLNAPGTGSYGSKQKKFCDLQLLARSVPSVVFLSVDAEVVDVRIRTRSSFDEPQGARRRATPSSLRTHT